MGLFVKKQQQGQEKANKWYKIETVRILHGTQVEIKTDYYHYQAYAKYRGYTGEVIGQVGLNFLVDVGGLAVEVYYGDVELVQSPLQGVQIQKLSKSACWND